RGTETFMIYDQRGFLTSRSEGFNTLTPLTTTFIPDADGNVTITVDPSLLRWTYTHFDLMNRPYWTHDPIRIDTSTEYDPHGNVPGARQRADQHTRVSGDHTGRPTAPTDPRFYEPHTTCDADGRVTETIDPLFRHNKTHYDLDGRVTETIDALGKS